QLAPQNGRAGSQLSLHFLALQLSKGWLREEHLANEGQFSQAKQIDVFDKQTVNFRAQGLGQMNGCGQGDAAVARGIESNQDTTNRPYVRLLRLWRDVFRQLLAHRPHRVPYPRPKPAGPHWNEAIRRPPAASQRKAPGGP